ncbi:unnamed protein product [Candida verbasci]|uniref:Lethal giant larvae (Lgl)-like C-terminal domain-containing protein n=1 Tax=Candida verbasci TaxID=1227364 RepID=A0A9W4U110_9ASCO|nr:unnamed protein product [Candida verbasci]
MFSKFKSKKPPLSLNSVSNAIKSHGNKNLSPDDSAVNYKNFDIRLINQLGIPKNSIVAVAYDPVQSLLAISTKNNDVRVYGQLNVEVVFEFNLKHPITYLKVVKGVYLACASPGSGLTILSLYSKKIIGTFSFPGSVTAAEADPSLDFLIFGLANGSIIFYDIDRCNLTPFRIDNLQKKVMPKEKLSSVISIEWHPRDIGTLLIGYNQCAIVYSLVTNEIKSVLVYQLSKDHRAFQYSQHILNNGKKKVFGKSKDIIVDLKEAHYHPNGLHAVTIHVDNSIVFWDIASGSILEARTIFETGIHKPGPSLEIPELFNPIETVKWVCADDPEDTKLIISGGDINTNCLHILDFGYTLKYSITSLQKQGEFYANPQQGQRIIPISFYLNKTNEIERITRIVPITENGSPYFHNGHDPTYLLLISNLGQVYIVSFNQGSSDIGSTILPTSLSFINPPLSVMEVQQVFRMDWYSIMSHRVSQGVTSRTKTLLYGGAPVSLTGVSKSIGHNDSVRNILITGHENALIRFSDVTKGEQSDIESVVQVSLKETLYDYGDLKSLRVTFVSCSFENRELLVGLANGEVVICKFGKNNVRNHGIHTSKDYSECLIQHENGDAKLLDISSRISGSVTSSSAFLPVNLLQLNVPEEISFMKMSNVGFGAIGFKSGRLIICDISRGPAIIYNQNIKDNLVSIQNSCHITCMEFSIMENAYDGYSSILLFVGTNGGGNFLVFKIQPMGNGGFEVVFVEKTTHLNHRSSDDNQENSNISQIIPINALDGSLAIANMTNFNKLSHGIKIPGFILVCSNKDVRILRTSKQKLAHKVIDDTCIKSAIINYREKGILLAILTKTGFIKFCSLPTLSDLFNIKIPKEIFNKLTNSFESNLSNQSDFLSSGELFVRNSKTESIYLSIYEKGKRESKNDDNLTDALFNENAIIPPRPSASALSWAKGDISYVSLQDLSLLIAGPNRKPPKHKESEISYNISPEANPQVNYGRKSQSPTNNLESSTSSPYKQPVRKAQTQTSFGSKGFLNSLSSGLQGMEESVHEGLNSIGQSVNEGYENQKKDLYNSAIKSKFGF